MTPFLASLVATRRRERRWRPGELLCKAGRQQGRQAGVAETRVCCQSWESRRGGGGGKCGPAKQQHTRLLI